MEEAITELLTAADAVVSAIDSGVDLEYLRLYTRDDLQTAIIKARQALTQDKLR